MRRELDEVRRIERARGFYVVKHNTIIREICRRKSELGLLERKALNFIISLIKPNDSQSECVYVFDIQDFCKICGIDDDNGKNYINAKAALKRLADNSFWIREGNDEVLIRWIDSVRITKKSGKISVRFSKEIAPYLFNLSNDFTRFELYQTLGLQSCYSISMYELLKSHSFDSKSKSYSTEIKSLTLSIEELKKFLGISDKYSDFRDLRKRVIDVFTSEINDLTDVKMSWTPIRKGHSYARIKFEFSTKKQMNASEAYDYAMQIRSGRELKK